MKNARSKNEAIDIISNTKLSLVSSNLLNNEKYAINQGLNKAEDYLCSDETLNSLNGQTELRGWCWECVTEASWVFIVVAIIVTVAVWIIAVVTFGLAAGWATAISFAVWTLIWVTRCWLYECEDELCPEGQTPTCSGSFVLDEEGRRCINPNLPSNAFIFGDCVLSPRPITGICPVGSIGVGANCQWDCFFPPVKNLGKGDDGKIQFNYECI